MRTRFALVLAALTLISAPAFAQGDPVSGAAERFFSVRPGGSAPASPYDYGGDKCEDTAEGTPNIWWGRFAGGRHATGGRSDDRSFFTHTGQGCFASRGACEAWMQALKNKFNAKPIYNQCRRGYEPGAPVPPWWAPQT
jgi:hypothetical protein